MPKIHQTQMQMTVEGLKNQPLTMLMLSSKTGIERANLCRYISRLQRSKNVALFKKGHCQITRRLAGYYTSDPVLFPQNPQLKLF